MNTTATIDARIGGGYRSSLRLTSAEFGDPTMLIDQYLARRDEATMFVEVKRDDPRAWEQWREDDNQYEFMRVGITGDYGAIEYVRGGYDLATRKYWHDPARVTVAPSPIADPPEVMWDLCVPHYFPRWTLVAASQVRQAMIDYVATGTLSNAVPWTTVQDAVGTEDPAEPRAA